MTSSLILFYLLAGLSVLFSLLVVFHRNVVYSALFLIITMGSLAGIYILLDAHFVWVIQVIVYAGAIMVLFLFVIILLDIRSEPAPWAPPDRGRILIAVLLSGVLLAELMVAVARRFVLAPAGGPAVASSFGRTQTVGRLLFTDFLFPFEITSIILLVAMVAAIALTSRRRKDAKSQVVPEQIAVRKADRLRLIKMSSEKHAQEKIDNTAEVAR